MRKYVVISADQNPDYLYYLPLTAWCWEKIGWHVIVFYRGELINNHYTSLTLEKLNAWDLDAIEGIRNATISQVSRLYAACLSSIEDDDLIMTADADMLPLSDYWNPDPSKITCYGHDLTGYGEIPICYISMVKTRWVEVMCLTKLDHNQMIKRDILASPNAKSDDFYRWWGIDQQIITERINAVNFEKDFIKRGQYSNGYAVGRVDRGAWTLNHKQFIDAHLFHQMYHKGREDKFEQTLDLLEKIWPDENFDWFILYTEKFRKLTGHA